MNANTQALAAGAREQGYYNLLSYIVSNAISGEIMAVENYSEMVPLFSDVPSKLEANKQAADESKHILVLAKLGARLNFPVQRRIVEPQWLKIREHFSLAAKKGDLAACLIIQDIMTETMAILLYKMLRKESDTDPDTAKVADNLLNDELGHLQIGIDRIKRLREQDPERVNDALVWAHHRVMPQLFGMISTSCHFLCDELNLECGSLQLSQLNTNIETIRVEALQQYMESLEKAGFSDDIVNPLIASMSAYEGAPSMKVAGQPCCGPGSTTTAATCC